MLIAAIAISFIRLGYEIKENRSVWGVEQEREEKKEGKKEEMAAAEETML